MIRINKNPQVPASLQSEKVQDELTRLERKASGGDRIVYSDFNDELYGAQEVRAVLKEDQHGKCAYCESKMNVTSPADIEHFRPKTYSKQDENSGINRPGYYWLAYDWKNLLAACPICNREYKRNYFPLENPEIRANMVNKDISQEIPLLVNPYEDRPENHIRFHKEVAVPVDEKGRHTIKFCGLNRKELMDVRKEKYELCRILQKTLSIINADDSQYKEVISCLESIISPQSAYYGMFLYQDDIL